MTNDALDMRKAFPVDKGPTSSCWPTNGPAAFVEGGYAANLEDFIAKNPDCWRPSSCRSGSRVSYRGALDGIPQDSEVRMYFLNNDQARTARHVDKDIAALPAKVDAG